MRLIYNKNTRIFSEDNTLIDLSSNKSPKKKYLPKDADKYIAEIYGRITEFILSHAKSVKPYKEQTFTIKYPVEHPSAFPSNTEYIYYDLIIYYDRDSLTTDIIPGRIVPGWMSHNYHQEITEELSKYKFEFIDEFNKLREQKVLYLVCNTRDGRTGKSRWVIRKVNSSPKYQEGLLFEDEDKAKEFLTRIRSNDELALEIYRNNAVNRR